MATEIHIHLDAGRLNFPLRTIWQGELSSADIVLRGVPAGFEAVGDTRVNPNLSSHVAW